MIKLIKGKTYLLSDEKLIGVYIGGCEFDVDGELGLYDVNNAVYDIEDIKEQNHRIKDLERQLELKSLQIDLLHEERDDFERQLEEALDLAEKSIDLIAPISQTAYERKQKLFKKLNQLKEKGNE